MSRSTSADSESVPTKKILRSVAVLGFFGAIGAYAFGGGEEFETFVEILTPGVVVLSLLLLAWEHERSK